MLVAIDKQGRWTLAGEATLLEASGNPRALGIREGGEGFNVPVDPPVEADPAAATAVRPSGPAQVPGRSEPAGLESEDVIFPAPGFPSPARNDLTPVTTKTDRSGYLPGNGACDPKSIWL